MGIPHAAPLLLLSNHEPLRWVHGWGPIAGLRARTQGSCAVSSAIPPGAETSGRVPMLTHCRSAQLTKQVLLQDAMRLSGAAYTVGGDRRAGTLFVCRGRCPHRPACKDSCYSVGAAPCGRPTFTTAHGSRPPPTVYVEPLRRRSSCRSRRSGLLRRTAVSKHGHLS